MAETYGIKVASRVGDYLMSVIAVEDKERCHQTD